METETFNGKSVYTLTQVGQSIQSMIERTYKYPYYIKAEMVKLNLYARTGHCYPELVEKDGARVKAQMRAVIWANQYQAINDRFIRMTGEPLRDGISILCLATIEFSPQYGLALYIQDIEPSFTMGEMARIRIQTIERLKKEQVFAANRALAMPLLPQRIAVISIETSKGYSDFMITLRSDTHHYFFKTELFPSLLQGEKAVRTMCEQLDKIEKRKDEFDCVAIIRGGGGDVGLSCYDQYELAHRVATFPLPILSGVGHSTNETVTEMVSFANKITPTEVAYFILSQFQDFDRKVADCQQYLYQSAANMLKDARQRIAQQQQQLRLVTGDLISRETRRLAKAQSSVQYSATQIVADNRSRLAKAQSAMQFYGTQMVADNRSRLSMLSTSLQSSARDLLSSQRQQCAVLQDKSQFYAKQLLTNEHRELQHLEQQLRLLNPSNILKRGFSITLVNGKPLLHASDVNPGDEVATKLYDGTFTSKVLPKQ